MTKQEKLELLIKTSILYYRGEETGLSDKEYDNLVKQFPEINVKQYSLLVNGETVEHRFEIYDRNKETVEPSFFENKEYKELSKDYWITPKMDGSSIVGYYENGILKQIITRGDNVQGKEKTLSLFDKLPYQVDKNVTAIEGEAVTEIFYGRSKANGLINSKEMQNEVNELITIIPFYIHTKTNKETYEKRFEMIGKNIPIYNNDKPEIEIDGKIFPIDGIVCYPKGEWNEDDIFIKKYYYIDAYKTEITDLEWNKSQYGIYVPTIVFKPVKFGENYTVQRCSSGGIMKLMEIGLGIGAKIKVILSGLTIPKVLDVVKPNYDIDLPVCNICGKKTEIYNNECRCVNEDCEEYKTTGTKFNDILSEFKISGGLKSGNKPIKFKQNKEYNKDTCEEFWTKLEQNVTSKKFNTCILYRKQLDKRLLK